MNALSGLAAFLTAFALSLMLTPAVRSLARRSGLVAVPRSDRWHAQPTALVGGAAIFVSFVAAAFATGAVGGLWPLILGGGYFFAIGLLDDLVDTKPATKLVLQLVGAASIAAAGYRFDLFESETLDLMVTIFWIVGLTNAFNLLDNMDGLAAGIALLAGGALVVLAVRGEAPTVALLAAFCGATAGFLVFNFQPASIFMGDSGSLFIGGILASMALVQPDPARSPLISLLAGPVLILLVPILDTTFVAVCRTLAGRRISAGGRDHTSHRLVAIGLSERRAVLLLYTVAAGGGVLAISLPYAGPGALALALTAYLVGLGLLLVHLGAVRVYGDEPQAVTARGTYTPLLLALTYRRRLFEVLLDFLLAGAAYYTAYRLRFEGHEFAEYFPVFLQSLPLVLASRTFALWLVGTYRGFWRYFGIADLGTLVRGVALGSAGAIVTVVYVSRFDDFSRGIFIIDALLFGVLVAGSRLSFRIIADYVTRRRRTGRRIVIYGAGDAGALLVRELRSNHRAGLIPIAFVDDDPAKRGRLILGVPVVGGRDRLGDLLSAGGADEVVISTEKLSSEHARAVAEVCDALHVPVYLARVVFDRVGSVSAVH